MSEGRSIKKLVQLVVLDNNRTLLSRVHMQRGMSLAFNLGEFTADPSKDIYMTQDGLCRSFSTDKERQGSYFPQKINFFFIDNTNDDRLYNFRECAFPRRLYEIFTNLKDKQCLKEFMTHKELDGGYDFCVFPNKSEERMLEDKYRKAKQKEFSNYCTTHKVEYIESKSKINEIAKDVIKKINIDFIWEKQQQMHDFLKKYHTGDLQEHKILWLNAQLENVSEILMNNDNYLWGKIRKGTINDTTSLNKRTDGEKDMRNALLVPAYRIYGHYALCCLEIFIDIQDEFRHFVCKRCQRLIFTGKKSKRKSCSKDDNKKCFMNNQNARKRKSYEKKKKQKEEEII